MSKEPAVKVPPPPPKEFNDGLTTMERLLQLAGSITDEEAEDLMEGVRRSRELDPPE